jgi:hypothetical protein
LKKLICLIAPLALLLGLTGCGATDTPSETLEAPPATLEGKIERIQDDPNLSEERKASAIEMLKQQEQAKEKPDGASPAPGK